MTELGPKCFSCLTSYSYIQYQKLGMNICIKIYHAISPADRGPDPLYPHVVIYTCVK